MNKQKMRRSAAAVTAITLLATFGAVAYFQDIATTGGDATGGDFTLLVNGDPAGDLEFTSTKLYPIGAEGGSEKDAIFANWELAAKSPLVLGHTAPVKALAFLDTAAVDSPTAPPTYNSALRWMVCLQPVAPATNPSDPNRCTNPAGFAADGTVPAGAFDTAMAKASSNNFNLYVWLTDTGEAQAQAVTSDFTFGFTGRTGAGTETLPLGPPPVQFAAHNWGSADSVEIGSNDGFVAHFGGDIAREGLGYVITPGGTISGRAFEKIGDDWFDAARKKNLYINVIEMLDEEDGHYKEVHQFTSVTTDDLGRFSVTLPVGATSDNAVLLYISKSAAATGVSPLVALTQRQFDGGYSPDAMQAADDLEGKRPMDPGFDNNWFVNRFAA